MQPSNLEILATVLFVLAVTHTFAIKWIESLSNKYPKGSMAEKSLHFLAEAEVIFGLWAALLFVCIAVMNQSIKPAVAYIEGLNFTEAKFVLVVMIVAATRPIVLLGEWVLNGIAHQLPLAPSVAFYFTALSVGTLLGAFITEPAAMTLIAIMLKRRYFDRGISLKFAYATIGLLFVNISIGGTLTHFAAPPVLMVAHTWGWDTPFMLVNFGWRAAISTCVSAAVVAWMFRKELLAINYSEEEVPPIPKWLTFVHVMFLATVVYLSHYPDVLFGVLMLFVGVTIVTKEHQDPIRLKEGLLVGFFLAGLVTIGNLQAYWLKPIIESLDGSMMFFGALGIGPIIDNAALTYLGSLVEGITPELQRALVAGAVCGGGLTVIANAPNPAGVGILQPSKVFGGKRLNPLMLAKGALLPTFIAVICFWAL